MPQAKSQNTTSTFDPLIWAATEIKRLSERRQDLDHLPTAIGTEGIYRGSEKDDLDDRINIIRWFLSVMPAKSLAGCVAQLTEMGAIADLAFGITAEDDDAKTDGMRYRRMAFSVEKYLISLLPNDLAEKVAIDHENLNPWRPYQERLAIIAERRVA